MSHRHFIEVFQARVGTTPKLFQRLRRFQRALPLAQAGSDPDWAQLALQVGYYDQSHLIRDFLAFSGLTPANYARQWSAVEVKEHLIAIAPDRLGSDAAAAAVSLV
jgi:methylphosphotriester-DNA--protein-cysteine methyltransferase